MPAYPIWAYYAHGRQRRCQEDPVSLPSGRLEKTTIGRPRITWLSNVQQDLKHHHLTLPEAVDLAQNRPLWRMMSTYGATQSLVACQKRRRRCRYPTVKKFEDMFIHFDRMYERDRRTDRQTDTAWRHRLRLRSIVAKTYRWVPWVGCYRSRSYARRGLWRRKMSVRLSVCPSHAVILSKHIIKIFRPSGSHTTLVLPYRGNIPTGTPLTGVSNAGAYVKISIFDQYISEMIHRAIDTMEGESETVPKIYQFQWPSVTTSRDFKVTKLFNVK